MLEPVVERYRDRNLRRSFRGDAAFASPDIYYQAGTWDKARRIGAKVVRHGRYVTFQLAEVAVPRRLFAEISRPINGLRPKPTPTRRRVSSPRD